MKLNGFDLVYEKSSKMMGGNGVSGTIRTIPANYYVCDVTEDGHLDFRDLESMTRGKINKFSLNTAWYIGLIPEVTGR